MVLTDSWPFNVIFVATLGLNISETKPDSGMVPMHSLQENTHGLSIGDDDVTWPHDVIMVTSCFFSVKCFFSGNVPLYGMYIGQDAFRVAPHPTEVRPRANLIAYRLVSIILILFYFFFCKFFGFFSLASCDRLCVYSGLAEGILSWSGYKQNGIKTDFWLEL